MEGSVYYFSLAIRYCINCQPLDSSLLHHSRWGSRIYFRVLMCALNDPEYVCWSLIREKSLSQGHLPFGFSTAPLEIPGRDDGSVRWPAGVVKKGWYPGKAQQLATDHRESTRFSSEKQVLSALFTAVWIPWLSSPRWRMYIIFVM